MTAAIDALDLPVQLLTVGSAIGMTSALVEHIRTGETDHWPRHIAICALPMFFAGILFAVIEALS